MIYEETYQFLLHNVSSTEFDACLYSLLKTDWDGVIQTSAQQIAEQIGTTKKYMKQIIKKFSVKRSRKVLVPVTTENRVSYALNIGKQSNLGFNEKTDLYCKKYSFFYTEAFRSLPINAKRLLLMGAFRMSVLKSEEVKFDYNEIVPNTYSEGNSFFTRGRLIEAIQAIQESKLSDVVRVSLASRLSLNRNEVILFSFNTGTLNDFLENYTERTLLRHKAYDAGFLGFIKDEICIEIEKVAKHLFTSLSRLQNEYEKKVGVICGIRDEVKKLARYIYNSSIKKWARSLNSNKQLLDNPKQASAYFSSIISEAILIETNKYSHQAESIQNLLSLDYLHKEISSNAAGEEVGFLQVEDQIKPIEDKYNMAITIATILGDWYENWVVARVKSKTKEVSNATEDSGVEKEGLKPLINSALEYIRKLKRDTYDQINKQIVAVSSYGNKALKNKARIKFLEERKEIFQASFAIYLERIENAI